MNFTVREFIFLGTVNLPTPLSSSPSKNQSVDPKYTPLDSPTHAHETYPHPSDPFQIENSKKVPPYRL